LKSLPNDEYQVMVQPLSALYASSFASGARETTTKVVSLSLSIDRSPSASTNPVHPLQPLSHAGSNMK